MLTPAFGWAAASLSGASPVVLENGNHRLVFDPVTAGIVSFTAQHAAERGFVPRGIELPAFAMQYLDSGNQFRQITSSDAAKTTLQFNARSKSLTAKFERLAGHEIDVTITVRMANGDPVSYWGLSLENRANLRIADVQFPFIVVAYMLAAKDHAGFGTEWLLIPFWNGRLIKKPQPQQLTPDSPHAWQFRPENQNSWHYPGLMMAQFLAYGNDRAGILIRCLDTAGHVKQFQALHHAAGLRLGISHSGDWPRNGARSLEYEIGVQAFAGDWYEAAGIYRDWSLKQHWARTPLHRRTDVPTWLLESPPHIMIRLQGELDAGPVFPNESFLPYPKLVPLLDRIAKAVNSPVVPVVMAWEQGGPWVYPDCFPPIGGDESLAEFSRLARERGWHVGSYSNGTRWVTGQLWSGYDGEDYFREHGGEKSVCRTVEGHPWRELWDISWRSSYPCCLGVDQTHQLATDYVKRLVSDGIDWIQFLDQNVGCSTFPCYSPDHRHPPEPGHWMTVAMIRLLEAFRQIAAREGEKSNGARMLVFSVESTPNEFFLPYFPVCDVRVSPPGHKRMLADYVPLYHFLHHEFLLLQGGFGFGPEPFHLPIQTAYNCVLGEICGGVLTGDGTLLNKDSINWAPWQPTVGSNENALEMLRCATALRRTNGKEYLVFGRMQRPAHRLECQTVHWTHEEHANAIPAVFHAAWKSPRGRFAVALSNWTKQEQQLILDDERFRATNQVSVSARVRSTATWKRGSALILPALSCAVIEAGASSDGLAGTNA